MSEIEEIILGEKTFGEIAKLVQIVNGQDIKQTMSAILDKQENVSKVNSHKGNMEIPKVHRDADGKLTSNKFDEKEFLAEIERKFGTIQGTQKTDFKDALKVKPQEADKADIINLDAEKSRREAEEKEVG